MTSLQSRPQMMDSTEEQATLALLQFSTVASQQLPTSEARTSPAQIKEELTEASERPSDDHDKQKDESEHPEQPQQTKHQPEKEITTQQPQSQQPIHSDERRLDSDPELLIGSKRPLPSQPPQPPQPQPNGHQQHHDLLQQHHLQMQQQQQQHHQLQHEQICLQHYHQMQQIQLFQQQQRQQYEEPIRPMVSPLERPSEVSQLQIPKKRKNFSATDGQFEDASEVAPLLLPPPPVGFLAGGSNLHATDGTVPPPLNALAMSYNGLAVGAGGALQAHMPPRFHRSLNYTSHGMAFRERPPVPPLPIPQPPAPSARAQKAPMESFSSKTWEALVREYWAMQEKEQRQKQQQLLPHPSATTAAAQQVPLQSPDSRQLVPPQHPLPVAPLHSVFHRPSPQPLHPPPVHPVNTNGSANSPKPPVTSPPMVTTLRPPLTDAPVVASPIGSATFAAVEKPKQIQLKRSASPGSLEQGNQDEEKETESTERPSTPQADGTPGGANSAKPYFQEYYPSSPTEGGGKPALESIPRKYVSTKTRFQEYAPPPSWSELADVPKMDPIDPDDDKKKPVRSSEITASDVLLGRGGMTNTNPGNIKFRELVSKYRMAYCTAPKGDKGALARYLCNYVRSKLGRFLRKEDSDGCWYEVGDEKAVSKCGQALREGTAAMIRRTMIGGKDQKQPWTVGDEEESEEEDEDSTAVVVPTQQGGRYKRQKLFG